MSNVSKILEKVECMQNEKSKLKNEESVTFFKLGEKSFLQGDYNSAEYWWEKGAENGCLKSKNALTSLVLQSMDRNSIYNIPISACRRTCGGNAPSYIWDRTRINGKYRGR
ncbi:hypothetical protein SAMN04487775_107116 [Treponema bryantii]|uniref:Sel1 repeat-containing protein n=1 Tax=Treponema bryantii TaxID=163 RepID=A0A1I3LP98_9SPIR|nr:hypothetical protein [Treponema bryantii]SFI86594.1 hypothetical protein SAMN04487775_107116 [Treponema bryantii]